jgi:hypothetical protein
MTLGMVKNKNELPDGYYLMVTIRRRFAPLSGTDECVRPYT